MKIDFKNCSEKELWQFVAVHLKKHGIDTVLVGGSVVSVYTDGAYKSGDLDFVKLDLFTTGIEKAMKEIGFKKMGAGQKCGQNMGAGGNKIRKKRK